MMNPLIHIRFICAMLVMEDLYETIYKNQTMTDGEYTVNELLGLAHHLKKLKEAPKIKSLSRDTSLSKDDFKNVLEFLAPKLIGNEIVNLVADNGFSEDEFQGELYPYYETVLKYFSAWKSFMEHRFSNFRRTFERLLKKKYPNPDQYEIAVQEFFLLQSRDHALGNFTKHQYWELYREFGFQKREDNFFEVLDEFYEGWCLTNNSIDQFYLLLEAMPVEKFQTYDRDLIYFEPFITTPFIGMPQSKFCKSSKHDFDYFGKYWFAGGQRFDFSTDLRDEVAD
ncbi:uncharacterized protein LOC135845780 [Planococcus citri]|uniref:uncharacterized protein LOC135845780 n=1 Tax=Planococcus citri TaxID=170843 RepID=UPI0031F7AA22